MKFWIKMPTQTHTSQKLLYLINSLILIMTFRNMDNTSSAEIGLLCFNIVLVALQSYKNK